MKPKTKPGMKHSRAPWTAKLKPEMKPVVVTDPKGRGRMLLPTPLLVAKEISEIPSGSLITVAALRLHMARRLQADFTCPLMTGIFFNIIAGAAEELLASGQPPLAPYWRVVLDDGTLSPKSPPGPEQQAARLRAEGHSVVSRRAKLHVADYQTCLVSG